MSRTRHNLVLSDPWYTLTKAKIKTVEGRLCDAKRSSIKVGDFILFSNKDQTDAFQRRVVQLTTHQSFKEMIISVGLRQILPGILTPDDGVRIYMEIPSYKDNEHLGVIAIHLEDSTSEE